MAALSVTASCYSQTLGDQTRVSTGPRTARLAAELIFHALQLGELENQGLATHRGEVDLRAGATHTACHDFHAAKAEFGMLHQTADGEFIACICRFRSYAIPPGGRRNVIGTASPWHWPAILESVLGFAGAFAEDDGLLGQLAQE